MANDDVHLHGGRVSCNNLQDLRVAVRSVIESRDIDKGYRLIIENERRRELDLGRARLRAQSDSLTRATCEIDELEGVG